MRLVAVLITAILVGCSRSSTSPPPGGNFNGTWTGTIEGQSAFILNSTQTGTEVSGSGTLTSSGTVDSLTFGTG